MRICPTCGDLVTATMRCCPRCAGRLPQPGPGYPPGPGYLPAPAYPAEPGCQQPDYYEEALLEDDPAEADAFGDRFAGGPGTGGVPPWPALDRSPARPRRTRRPGCSTHRPPGLTGRRCATGP